MMVPLWFLLAAIEAAYDDPREHVTSWKNARMPRWSRRAQSAVGIRNQQTVTTEAVPIRTESPMAGERWWSGWGRPPFVSVCLSEKNRQWNRQCSVTI